MKDENEPPFILGLRNAKKMLLELRARKVKQQQIQEIAQTPVKDAAQDNVRQPSQFSRSQKVKESPSPVTFKERTFALHTKINEIGRELFEGHNECEAYQSILNNLAEHYAENLPTVELNEKLKKKSYELREHIDQYRRKIDHNQQQISSAKHQEEQVKKIIKEHLWAYLVGEAQKSADGPHQKVKFRHNLNAKAQKIANEYKDSPRASLELRYGALRKQVARKPMVKKATVEEEELRRPFYSSQLYSL